ncbi:hypothetical protein SEUCBS139899_009220 [Sporothrix eucalyptigena]|uniref:Mitochondrial outer membrane transport complex Sam37/metaxin N-terminal domain-containing protein n=1 Tax=Sporothrix eucalyptigena TaxID=1812306 RepID=A0ABP0D042_9PEZI
MSLELHIWGAAFGLPSIDPECLAAVAYLSVAAPQGEWTAVATSPSAVPHTLPALRDAQTGRWVASGFDSLVAFVKAQAASSSSSSSSPFRDLDAGLTPDQAADSTAYSAFLRAEAGPLLALSLYVSSANWAATTRPAYSRILPFPLTWIEPPSIRASDAAKAAHLGFSSLDTDNDPTDDDSHASSLAAALHAFPDRIRKTVSQQDQHQQQQHQQQEPKTVQGQKSAAKSLSIAAAASRVSQSLTPEAKAQIRLDEAARACLSVLAQQKGSRRTFLRGGDDDGSDLTVSQLTSLDCLAFGYLALMIMPDVPRPFLRDALRRHHHDLAVFVADIRHVCLKELDDKPEFMTATTVTKPRVRYANPLWLRTLHGIVHSLPGLSGEWIVWLWRRIRVDEADEDDDEDESVARWRRDAVAARWQRLAAVSTTLAGTALFVGLILSYRQLPAFGSRIVVYRRAATGFAGLGAAGALLSSL